MKLLSNVISVVHRTCRTSSVVPIYRAQPYLQSTFFWQSTDRCQRFGNLFVIPSCAISTTPICKNICKLQLYIQALKKINPAKMTISSAVLRYERGAERFQFSFTTKSGRSFNFDRPSSETVESFLERVKNNVQKKIKFSEVTSARLLTPTTESEASGAVQQVLDHMLDSQVPFKFQVNEEEMQVLVNPPEVYSIKFSSKPLIGCPIVPSKMETSGKFDRKVSQFKWEYTTDSDARKPKPSANAKWHPCKNGDQMVFVPDESLNGAYLRVTCTPSDGDQIGFPTSEEVKFPVQSVDAQLLYLERLARMEPAQKDGNVLRFVTYNILANAYTTEEWFSNSPPESLDYEYRLPLLLKELEAYQGDLVCMQEMDDKAFEYDFKPFLQHTQDMDGVFSCKLEVREGVATFYNTKKLKLVETNTITLVEEFKSLPFVQTVVAHKELNLRFDERNTVLQLSVFERLNDSNSLVVVGNTHLYFHPNADHIRLLQTITCISTIEKKVAELRQNNPDKKISVFFCGDFNCTPPFSSYRLLTSGKVEADDIDWFCYEPEALRPGIAFTHSLKLTDPHPEQLETNYTAAFSGCLDYILYQQDACKLIKTYPPPDRPVIAQILKCREDQVSLPNFSAPSDHLPLVADFTVA